MQLNRHRKAVDIFLDCNKCEWIPYVIIYIKKLVFFQAYDRKLSIIVHLFCKSSISDEKEKKR